MSETLRVVITGFLVVDRASYIRSDAPLTLQECIEQEVNNFNSDLSMMVESLENATVEMAEWLDPNQTDLFDDTEDLGDLDYSEDYDS
jgi:hypothetical protein